MRLRMRHQQRKSVDEINNSFNPISLNQIFEDDDPLSEWVQEKENPLLDGGNPDWLPMDNSDDEMNIEQSHHSLEQNDSDSSSSQTPTQSGDGEDLSPSNDDGDGDGGASFSGDTVTNRPLSPYGRDYRLAASGGLFIDMSEYGVNQPVQSTEVRSERRARSKGKSKKKQYNTFEGSSSYGIGPNSSNFGYSESSESTQGYYPLEPSSLLQPPHHYLPPHGYYPPQPSFPNYHDPYQPQMCPSLQMYPPTQMYLPSPMYQEQEDNTGLYSFVFGQMSHGRGQSNSQSEGGGFDPPRHSTMW